MLRQMTSTLAVGSGLALGGAADAMSTSQKCVAVTWSLEVGAGGGGRGAAGLRCPPANRALAAWLRRDARPARS